MLFVNSANEVREGADALLVLTEWDEFKHLDYARICRSSLYPIGVDGRNLLSPEEIRRRGFIHLSMGRHDQVPSKLKRDASAEAVA